MTPQQPQLRHVHCLSAAGLHKMAYWEWGERRNPRVLICVHGLSRQGRDFDTLAGDLGSHYRVICPDVVGRGQSDWLADPTAYAVPTYIADMVTLVARLDVEQVDWFGTSMGGLIGLGLAAQPNSPIRKLVLNDVGPTIEHEAIQRIALYLGVPVHWQTVEEAADALLSVSQGFGPHTREQWLALTRPQLVPEGSGWKSHYDPAIAKAVQGMTPAISAASSQLLWSMYERISARTLLLRGAESDLLSPATAQAMTQRGPKALLHEFPGVGHAPMLVQPDQRAVVRGFLLGP